MEILNKIKYEIKKRICRKVRNLLKKFKNSDKKALLILRSILSSRLIIIYLAIILVFKARILYSGIEVTTKITSSTSIMTISFVAIIICPLFFIKRDKNRFFWVMIYNIFFSALLFADNVYYEYSANVLSASQLFYVKYAEEIGATLPMLLRKTQIIYFVDIVVLLPLWFIARKPIRAKKAKILKNKGKRRIVFAIVYTIVAINITASNIAYGVKKINEEPYEKNKQIQYGSIYGYHYVDLYNTINIKETAKYKTYSQIESEYEKLETYYEENYELDESLYGIAEGQNVIIVQLESVQNFVVNKTINGKEITPNLNKFLKENIAFTNMHVQSYSTTADSEYTVITSLYPLENGQAYSSYYASINNDIFSLYKNQGYYTVYMHGNHGGFWNRNAVYSRLDIDEIMFLDDFEDTSELINTYLSDELLYRQAIEKMSGYEEPFFTFMVAASSHTPFNLYGISYKSEKVSIDVGKYENTALGNYLEAVNYADYAFGIFIQELKDSGLYDNSVIIVYGDHAGLSMNDENLLEFMQVLDPNYNDISTKITYTNLLCGIRIPGVESKEITTPVSKVDIKPTLLELSGIEDNFSLGMSMFSNKDYAVISNATMITDKYYFNDVWYDIKTGLELDLETESLGEEKEKLKQYVENMELELDISRAIIINNIFKGVF